MNNQPVVHSSSSSNGFPNRRVEKVAEPFVKNTEYGGEAGSVDTPSKTFIIPANELVQVIAKEEELLSKVCPTLTNGPTVPSMYLDQQVKSDNDYDLNLFDSKEAALCINWLDTMPQGSSQVHGRGSNNEKPGRSFSVSLCRGFSPPDAFEWSPAGNSIDITFPSAGSESFPQVIQSRTCTLPFESMFPPAKSPRARH